MNVKSLEYGVWSRDVMSDESSDSGEFHCIVLYCIVFAMMRCEM